MDHQGINDKFFLEAMRNKDFSMRELAQKMGFSHHAQLSRTFSGERRIQLGEAVSLSQLLGIPFDEVIANAGFPEVIRAGPRIKIVGALGGTGEVAPVKAVERAIAPACVQNDTVAIQARTAETPLAWMDTFLFFCQPPGGVRPEAVSRFCYAKIKEGPAVMATVRRGYGIGTYNLTGPFERQNVELEWAEPITFTRNG